MISAWTSNAFMDPQLAANVPALFLVATARRFRTR
jgi:hypothetical protein